ncbi:phage tail protein I [Bombella pollinis]|uniref:Phage tail protein I n=1 Tax=Bombella pollinis TaxID=2967337 RepID=A0ABT3WUD4_9PROT|nr:phage tail protein I [Bombella pollinis]MCX5620501.1 phage tail protein I [Bombella pollinis]
MSERTLLPCNASALERALDITPAVALDSIPHYVRETANADTIPAILLPWLAWAQRVEVWDSTWSDEQKRAVIKSSFAVHRKKGTIGAVKSALAALGVSLTVVEWFNDTPQREPYTFRLVADPGDNALRPAFWNSLLAIVERTKNARSHMGVTDIQKRSSCEVFSSAVVLFSVGINIPEAPEVDEATYHAGGMAYGIGVRI